MYFVAVCACLLQVHTLVVMFGLMDETHVFREEGEVRREGWMREEDVAGKSWLEMLP